MAVLGDFLYTTPRSEEHLRAVIHRIKQFIEEAGGDITEITNNITLLLGIIGPRTATFDETAVKGNALVVSGANSVQLADGTDIDKSAVVGLAFEDVTAAAEGTYIPLGFLSNTDWTDVVGSTSLTPGARYFLGAEPGGKLTATGPDTDGHVVTEIGLAISASVILIVPAKPILL